MVSYAASFLCLIISSTKLEIYIGSHLAHDSYGCSHVLAVVLSGKVVRVDDRVFTRRTRTKRHCSTTCCPQREERHLATKQNAGEKWCVLSNVPEIFNHIYTKDSSFACLGITLDDASAAHGGSSLAGTPICVHRTALPIGRLSCYSRWFTTNQVSQDAAISAHLEDVCSLMVFVSSRRYELDLKVWVFFVWPSPNERTSSDGW